MSDEQINPSQENSPEVSEAPPVVTRTRGSRTRKSAAPAEAASTEAAVGADAPEAPEAVEASDAGETAARKAPAKRAAAKKAPAKKAAAKKAPAKRTAAKKTAAADAPLDFAADAVTPDGGAGELQDEVQATGAAESAVPDEAPAPTVTRTTRARGTRRTAKAAQPDPATSDATPETSPQPSPESTSEPEAGGFATTPLFQAPEKKAPARRTRKRAAAPETVGAASEPTETAPTAESAATATSPEAAEAAGAADGDTTAKPVVKRTRRSTRKVAAAPEVEPDEVGPVDVPDTETATEADVETGVDAATGAETDDATDETDETDDSGEDSSDDSSEGGGRRRRRRGGRRRRRSGDDDGSDSTDAGDGGEGADGSGRSGQGAGPDGASDGDADGDADGSSRRRRRRRRGGESGDSSDDSDQGSPRGRRPRNAEDEITSLAGSTRLEAKKQRRREGREAGRRRAPIVSEAEFLARRESVDRTMVIRQRDELTQIAVLEDKVLVEHYVARESQTSLIGNVYLGRVQNVLPSMEAAFIDIGKGRNAVLYAGEVNWSSLGHREGQPRKIESVLTSGQPILVQVTKDPVGHKGARLSSQVSLAGRFLVYVPDGTTSGISRKLPDTERNRLKTLLKEIVPETAGVIVRTAAEGASEAELTQDVERLKARWEDIEAKARGNAPQLLYGEPDLTLKVVRDLFTEDFTRLVIQGDDAWDTVQAYVEHVAPDLAPRLERYDVAEHSGTDLFATYRVDEQIAKGLDRKVWLPSGGSLVIDRTEAMTVVDVNTGKFTGSGGNLEETVTKNNLEAAEEIVRQLRLRDIGGIIVVDFIDMVLESNRDLVLRRLVECLGRDRTRHQVAEVTSLGLVQMTRKRIGTGLLEAFGQDCSACHGRGVIVHDHPVEQYGGDDDQRRGSGGPGGGGPGGPSRGRGRGGRGRGQDESGNGSSNGNGNGNGGGPVRPATPPVPSPTFVASIARPENADVVPLDERTTTESDPVAEVAAQVTAQVTPAVFPVSVPAQVVEPVQPAETPDVPGASETPQTPQTPQSPGSPSAQEDDARFPDEPEQQPEPTTVVSRTRRRSATRPAGPPAGAVGTVVSLDPAGDGGAAGDSGVVDGGEVPVVEKVPVKRRSSRRR